MPDPDRVREALERGWSQRQWIEDADRLMNEPDGAITSLVNGHVMALLAFWNDHKGERT